MNVNLSRIKEKEISCITIELDSTKWHQHIKETEMSCITIELDSTTWHRY